MGFCGWSPADISTHYWDIYPPISAGSFPHSNISESYQVVSLHLSLVQALSIVIPTYVIFRKSN
jgi:hypothetical protein